MYSHGCKYRRGKYSRSNEFPQEFGKYVEKSYSNIFSCIRAVQIPGPHALEHKLIPPKLCFGFVPGGICALKWSRKLEKMDPTGALMLVMHIPHFPL